MDKINTENINNNLNDANNFVIVIMKNFYSYINDIDRMLLSNFNIINYVWYALYFIYFIKGSKKNRDNLYSFNNYYKIYLSFILLTYFNPYSFLNYDDSVAYNVNNIDNDLKNICFTAGLLILLELYDYDNYLSQKKEIEYLKKKN